MIEFIIAILLYVLGCVCLITVGTIFGVVMTFTQAAAAMILITLVFAIGRNS